MTNLTAVPGLDAVPQIDITTPLLGGPGGPLNAQAQALLNRIEYEKAQLAEPSGAGLMGFQPAGAGAFSSNVQSVLRETVSVLRFMTPAQIADSRTGVAPTLDHTAAFEAAQIVADEIIVPAGRFGLNNFRPRTGKKFRCAGFESTFIHQFAAGAIAFHMLSDATVGQLLGIEFGPCQIIGHPAATAVAMHAEAEYPYAITYSKIAAVIKHCFQGFTMKCDTAGSIYHNKFYIVVDTTTSPDESVLLAGTYNKYDIFITNSGPNGFALRDLSAGSLFPRVITEGLIQLSGQRNHYLNMQVENYIAANSSPLGCAVFVSSTGHMIDNLSLITCANAKCPTGVKVFGGEHTITNYRVIGAAGSTASQIPMEATDGSQCTVINAQVVGTKMEAVSAGKDLRNWTFLGDCSTLITSPTIRGGNKFVRVTPTTGATIVLSENDDSLLTDHAATIAALTVTLPAAPKDQQTVRVTSVLAAITALTLTPGSGKSVVGAPAAMAAGGSFSLVYSAVGSSWYRLS